MIIMANSATCRKSLTPLLVDCSLVTGTSVHLSGTSHVVHLLSFHWLLLLWYYHPHHWLECVESFPNYPSCQ